MSSKCIAHLWQILPMIILLMYASYPSLGTLELIPFLIQVLQCCMYFRTYTHDYLCTKAVVICNCLRMKMILSVSSEVHIGNCGFSWIWVRKPWISKLTSHLMVAWAYCPNNDHLLLDDPGFLRNLRQCIFCANLSVQRRWWKDLHHNHSEYLQAQKWRDISIGLQHSHCSVVGILEPCCASLTNMEPQLFCS